MDSVCRTCMRIIDASEPIISINDTDLREKLNVCLPELQLDNVVDPKMCSTCSAALSLSFRFKGMCFEAEKTINNCLLNQTYESGELKPLNDIELLTIGRRDLGDVSVADANSFIIAEEIEVESTSRTSTPTQDEYLEPLHILSDVASQATKAVSYLNKIDFTKLRESAPDQLNYEEMIQYTHIQRDGNVYENDSSHTKVEAQTSKRRNPSAEAIVKKESKVVVETAPTIEVFEKTKTMLVPAPSKVIKKKVRALSRSSKKGKKARPRFVHTTGEDDLEELKTVTTVLEPNKDTAKVKPNENKTVPKASPNQTKTNVKNSPPQKVKVSENKTVLKASPEQVLTNVKNPPTQTNLARRKVKANENKMVPKASSEQNINASPQKVAEIPQKAVSKNTESPCQTHKPQKVPKSPNKQVEVPQKTTKILQKVESSKKAPELTNAVVESSKPNAKLPSKSVQLPSVSVKLAQMSTKSSQNVENHKKVKLLSDVSKTPTQATPMQAPAKSLPDVSKTPVQATSAQSPAVPKKVVSSTKKLLEQKVGLPILEGSSKKPTQPDIKPKASLKSPSNSKTSERLPQERKQVKKMSLKSETTDTKLFNGVDINKNLPVKKTKDVPHQAPRRKIKDEPKSVTDDKRLTESQPLKTTPISNNKLTKIKDVNVTANEVANGPVEFCLPGGVVVTKDVIRNPVNSPVEFRLAGGVLVRLQKSLPHENSNENVQTTTNDTDKHVEAKKNSAENPSSSKKNEAENKPPLKRNAPIPKSNIAKNSLPSKSSAAHNRTENPPPPRTNTTENRPGNTQRRNRKVLEMPQPQIQSSVEKEAITLKCDSIENNSPPRETQLQPESLPLKKRKTQNHLEQPPPSKRKATENNIDNPPPPRSNTQRRNLTEIETSKPQNQSAINLECGITEDSTENTPPSREKRPEPTPAIKRRLEKKVDLKPKRPKPEVTVKTEDGVESLPTRETEPDESNDVAKAIEKLLNTPEYQILSRLRASSDGHLIKHDLARQLQQLETVFKEHKPVVKTEMKTEISQVKQPRNKSKSSRNTKPHEDFAGVSYCIEPSRNTLPLEDINDDFVNVSCDVQVHEVPTHETSPELITEFLPTKEKKKGKKHVSYTVRAIRRRKQIREAKKQGKIFYVRKNPDGRSMRPKQPLRTCEMCGKVFKSISSFNVHSRSHVIVKSFECEICNKSFTLERYLILHMPLHFSAGENQCNECDKYFSTARALQRHMELHKGERPYVCDYCCRGFTTITNLAVHQRTHTKIKDYICYTCGGGFSQKVHLVSHSRTHTGEKPFACNQCPKTYAKSSTLRFHLALHVAKPFACESCNILFKEEARLQRHMEKYKDRFPHVPISHCAKLYTCGICGKHFGNRYGRDRHMKVHVKDLIEGIGNRF